MRSFPMGRDFHFIIAMAPIYLAFQTITMTHQNIVAISAKDSVGAFTAEQQIVTVIAFYQVITFAALNGIITWQAIDMIGFFRPA